MKARPVQKKTRYRFFFDIRYYIGLLDNSRVTNEGAKKLDAIYDQLFRFFEEQNIDPAEMGYGPDDVPDREPIHKFGVLIMSMGFKFCF
ncbi:MAG: hypothetical protein GF401_14385 [Chitinivibrionales bacterium]|nr:hypothetical protein [Chitinivibrionales bacterium]